MKQFFSLVVCVIVFWGCRQNTGIADLKKPQDATLYAQDLQIHQNTEALQKLKQEYLKNFFAPFIDLEPNPNTKEVFWIEGSLAKYPGYGENLEANSPEYTQGILENMQIDRYPSVKQKAIIIKDTNVRAVPTLRPRYSKSNGYPFDRWQNSLIFYGTPVLITHYDVSKRFAHIQTEFVYGWVEASDLAFVDPKQVKTLLGVKNFVMPNTDEGSLVDKNGYFLTKMRIGKLLMLDSKHRLFVFKRQASGHLKIEKTEVDLKRFHSFPQGFSPKIVAEHINTLMGQKYGWGGLNESRDCSSFVRDILGNFGLYLPRNSLAQAKFGNHQIPLENLSLKEKEKIILRDAIPFATLIWLKGHIMLYIGRDSEGNPLVAHSAWSVQTSDVWGKTEHKLGGVVITTLKPANEYNGWLFGSQTLGDRAKKINNLLPLLEGKE